eukprot:gene39185-48400_t
MLCNYVDDEEVEVFVSKNSDKANPFRIVEGDAKGNVKAQKAAMARERTQYTLGAGLAASAHGSMSSHGMRRGNAGHAAMSGMIQPSTHNN